MVTTFDGASNSAWLMIDKSTYVSTDDWHFNASMTDSATTSPIKTGVTAGDHVVYFYPREDGTKLHTLEIYDGGTTAGCNLFHWFQGIDSRYNWMPSGSLTERTPEKQA